MKKFELDDIVVARFRDSYYGGWYVGTVTDEEREPSVDFEIHGQIIGHVVHPDNLILLERKGRKIDAKQELLTEIIEPDYEDDK